jgi:hypothetical protein
MHGNRVFSEAVAKYRLLSSITALNAESKAKHVKPESIPPNEIVETMGQAKPSGLITARWNGRWYEVYESDLQSPSKAVEVSY